MAACKILEDVFVEQPTKDYLDKSFFRNYQEQDIAEAKSSTLYVKNFSPNISDRQVFSLFQRFGTVQKVVMGVDRVTRETCGFAFVEFLRRESALQACKLAKGIQWNGQKLFIDFDHGFREGRQFSRGANGDHGWRNYGGSTRHRRFRQNYRSHNDRPPPSFFANFQPSDSARWKGKGRYDGRYGNSRYNWNSDRIDDHRQHDWRQPFKRASPPRGYFRFGDTAGNMSQRSGENPRKMPRQAETDSQVSRKVETVPNVEEEDDEEVRRRVSRRKHRRGRYADDSDDSD